jgi:hypothetical protein
MVGLSRISFRPTLYRDPGAHVLRVSHAFLSLFPRAPSAALLPPVVGVLETALPDGLGHRALEATQLNA